MPRLSKLGLIIFSPREWRAMLGSAFGCKSQVPHLRSLHSTFKRLCGTTPSKSKSANAMTGILVLPSIDGAQVGLWDPVSPQLRPP